MDVVPKRVGGQERGENGQGLEFGAVAERGAPIGPEGHVEVVVVEFEEAQIMFGGGWRDPEVVLAGLGLWLGPVSH